MPLESLERLAATYPALDAGVERKRMLVIANPYATSMSDHLKGLVLAALQGRYDIEAVDTQRRNHATDICREAALEGYDVVVSFGGDGTVNEVANGLVGSDTPMTCLPGGATNVLNKMLGIPGDIVDATEHLLRMADHWKPRRIDLAEVNDRVFTFSSGFGLDAAVVKAVDSKPSLKHSMRQHYFAYAAVKTFLTKYVANPPKIAMHVGGEQYEGVTAIIQNGDPFTYFDKLPLHVAEGATLDSGTMAGVLLHRAWPTDVPSVAFRMFSKRASVTDHKRIDGFRDATELRLESIDGAPIPLQVDGDWIGDVTEAVYGIRPAALSVIA